MLDSFEFFNEHGQRIDHLRSERTEQEQASTYIPEDAKGVLELGSRYGTVTCSISHRIGYRPVLITVEPDVSVWQPLEDNIKRNGAKAFIVRGTISKTPIGFVKFQYGSFTSKDPKEGAKTVSEYYNTPLQYYTSINVFSLEEVQEAAQIPVIDTLVADCEGFLEQFMDENPHLYTSLNTFIFERDGNGLCRTDRCDYDKIEVKLKEHGFREIVSGFHAVWIKGH